MLISQNTERRGHACCAFIRSPEPTLPGATRFIYLNSVHSSQPALVCRRGENGIGLDRIGLIVDGRAVATGSARLEHVLRKAVRLGVHLGHFHRTQRLWQRTTVDATRKGLLNAVLQSYKGDAQTKNNKPTTRNGFDLR